MANSLPVGSFPISHSPTDNEVESYLPSTSAVAHPSSNCYYDVFINHRGPDVKKGFASLLYYRLTSQKLTVFLDKSELRKGEEIAPQIERAIRTASVHVAIFSEHYAESAWCLDELVLMKESGSVILPVFHDVKPYELRRTGGGNSRYAKALRDLEKKKDEGKPRYNSATIEKWRNALIHVAGISGFELEAYNGDQGELLEAVVKSVLEEVKKADKSSLYKVGEGVLKKVDKSIFGVDEKVEDFEKTVLLQEHQSGKLQVVGIVGLGGIGKTTLATELFNRKMSHYSKSWLFLNVKDGGTYNIEKAIEKHSKNDEKIQAFVVLDDVGNKEQVNAVLTAFQTVLTSDSLILITSRDRHVFPTNSSIYELSGLNPQHSRELFCSHAFGRSRPLPVFEPMVDKFLEACVGLPLYLKVFGSVVCGKNEKCWEDLLDRFQQIRPQEKEEHEKQILPQEKEQQEKEQQTLRICYNGLEKDEKEVFLDIVSFFIGEKRDTAIRMWDGSGWDGSRLFQNLLNKSLVEVDSENEIKMHDRLRDMGREIVEEVSLRRVFRWTENIDDLLQQLYNEHAITEVRGIRTGITTARDHKPWYKRIIHNLPANRLHNTNLQLLDVDDGRLVRDLVRHSPNLIWLRWQSCSYSSLPHLGSVENLRVLEVSSSVLKKLWKSQAVPLQLRELVVKSPLSELPDSTGQLQHLELIILDCPSGNLKTLPYEFCHLQSLKRCELKNCAEMKSLPQSFGSLTNLEYIDLSGSKKLERLPYSFGKLCSLKSFRLTDCLKIKSLPDSLGSLANLEHIDLSRSENLQSLPDSFGDLIRLKYLDLSCCNNLTISSNTLGNISTLEYINLSSCWKVEVLPLQVASQRSLQKLYCPFLEMVPSLLDGNLKELKLRNGRNDNELRCLPISAGRLNQLTKLTVNECELRERTLSNLGSSIDMSKLLHFFCEENEMPKLLQLRHIELYKTKISEISFAEGFCPKLQHLLIKSCDHLEKVGTLPNALIKLELTRCSKLEKIEGLCGLEKLQMLNIKWCRKMKELSNIEKLESLEVLDVNECMNLKSIRLHQAEKSQLTKLRRLEIVKCSQLEELRGVERLKSLERLDVSGCTQLQELPGVERLKSLERLDVSGCTQLQWDEGVLEQLRQLGPRFNR